MDEYEASYVRIEKISTAIQTIKENLTCRICLELFDEPVTIKCGHKFCRQCILKVTDNENSSCPFCTTKIQRRSIPKCCNTVLQESVKNFENLIKAIHADSGIDVLQPYNKAKNTKESLVEYSKPSTSKLEDTPSTSKGSSSLFNPKPSKGKVANSVRNRFSGTKKKTDIKSPSQNSGNNTLHKYYLSNKSDPVPDQVVHSQEKVKSWLESCTSEENDSIARDSLPGPSKQLRDSLTADRIGTPPHEIHCSPQTNEAKESDISPVPPSEKSSDSKFKETHMKIQEAEKMARKKKMSLSAKENNNVKTPSSMPATSQSDAHNWKRVKQVGREMQVKTFKTLNVSVERCSPSVVVDDTVLYNSSNNDSKNISHDSAANNTSADKTPLHTRKCDPSKSENNNLLKQSPQIVIEDYKHRSMDSTGSSKQDCATALDVDENQLNEIIGINSSASVSKTPEETKTSLKKLKGSNLDSKLKQLTPSKRKSSEHELSNDELSNCDSKTTAIHLPRSPKKNRLSLKSVKNSNSSKNSSPSGTLDKTSQKEKESSSIFSEEKSSCKLLPGPLHDKTNSIEQKIASTKSSLCDNLVKKRSSSSNGFRIIFQKLGKICKKRKNVPFHYLGRLQKEKCLFINSNSCRKTGIVIKSNIPVCVDYKSRIDDKNVANSEDFVSDESHSKTIASMVEVPLELPTKSSTVNNYEEAMNVDEDVDAEKPGQSEQQMEIDETLPSAKMIVNNNNNNLEKRNSENQINVQQVEDSSQVSLTTKKKSLESEDIEKVSPQIYEIIPEPMKNTDEDTIPKVLINEIEKRDSVSESSKNPEKKIVKCDSPAELSSKVGVVKNSTNFKRARVTSVKKRISDDLSSISSDDSEAKVRRTNTTQRVVKAKFNESCRKSGQKLTTDENNMPKVLVNEIEKRDSISKSSKNTEKKIVKGDSSAELSSKVGVVKNSTNFKQIRVSSDKKRIIPDDLISISSDDSEAKVRRTNTIQRVVKAKFNESCRKSGQKLTIKSDVESCTESEVSTASSKGDGKNVEETKQGYSSTSSSSLRPTGKKKRTHSDSSNDDADVVDIIDKWTKKAKTSLDSEKEQAAKKPKISVDSEEMINRNASKVKHRSRHSFSSSSDDDEEVTVKENKRQPNSLLSADLFESHEQSVQPMMSPKKESSDKTAIKITSPIDFDAQSDKENISERSPGNITVIDIRQLKRRKSNSLAMVDHDNKENSECNQTSDLKKSVKSTEETANEIESSQRGGKSIITKHFDNEDQEHNEEKQINVMNKTTEGHADEIESSQKNQNKTVDNFEHESDPYFVRESLLNITQEQIACKNIEKDLFGVDLSKIHENQSEEPLPTDKFSTPRRKPTNSEENDEFDSDNIAATPVVRRRQTLRLPSPSQSSTSISEIQVSVMSSPEKRRSLIPAITPMKNTKSYPLCHSTPMITMDSPENRIEHSQIENMKIVCSSLTAENTRLVQKFADRFGAQLQSNFDMDITHVVVKVDPQTKAGPKTFKYIQGIAFKKYVVSFEWITDCLAKGKLLDVDDEKYDVLDPDVLESGCKKSRLSSKKIFRNFAFCCLEPFVKVSLSEFEELLTYNGAVMVSSIREFHLHKDKLKIIIVGAEELDDEAIAILSTAEAAAVHFEWVVDSLSQFEILSLPSYLCETPVEKVRSLGFPPELLLDEDTLEEYEDDN